MDKLNNMVEIVLDGTPRTMRATFRAMRDIELSLNKPWAKLGEMVLSGDFGINELTTIIYHGLRGNNDTRLSFDEVGELVALEGMKNTKDAVVMFIVLGFEGTKSAVGKQEEEKSKKAK